MEQLRIVSLIASATEIVCALGLRDRLVGRSHECDYPPGIEKLPVLTGPKFNAEGPSRQIDDRVRSILRESLSVYRVDAELLGDLQPSHIITQAQCHVCAVSLDDVRRALRDCVGFELVVISLEPNRLSDLWSDIRRVGAALGAGDRADALIGALQQRMRDIAMAASRAKSLPAVASIEWIDPLMATGNWMPELIEMAGGMNLFGQVGQHSPTMSWEELAAADPEVIVVMPCGFSIERTLREMHILSRKPGWGSLRAVRAGRVFVADGNQYFNRPGPRLAESLEILAEIFHPDLFRFGHEGAGS